MECLNLSNQLPIFDDLIDEIKCKNGYKNNILYIPKPPPPPPPPPPPKPVPCFLKGSKILTTKGEINIEELKITDTLINHLGSKSNIVKITSFIRTKTEDTHPYIISKYTRINNFICNEDLYLSKDHAVLINNEYFIMAKDLPFAKQVTDLTCEEYEYFHIITENYLTDTIISNGLPTESFGCNLPKHIIPYIYKNKVRRLLTIKNNSPKLNKMTFTKSPYF